jgi:hypothetical protein
MDIPYVVSTKLRVDEASLREFSSRTICTWWQANGLLILQYQPDKKDSIKEPKILHVQHGVLHSLLQPLGQLVQGLDKTEHKIFDPARSMQIMSHAGASPADVVCWSGCLDTQTVSAAFCSRQHWTKIELMAERGYLRERPERRGAFLGQ